MGVPGGDRKADALISVLGLLVMVGMVAMAAVAMRGIS